MRPVCLLVFGGCLEVPAEDTLNGPGMVHQARALLVPCQTPSGSMTALGIIQGQSCDGAPPRDCQTWQALLQHQLACQPGSEILPRTDAVVFWLEGVTPDADLTAATTDQMDRYSCAAPPEQLLGDVAVRQEDDVTLVEFDADRLRGRLAFQVCR